MDQQPFDSTIETRKHILVVQGFLEDIRANLLGRAIVHDASKLEDPEKTMFDEFTPRLRSMTYGSDEYKACLEAMGPALKHHYRENTHHPEHYDKPISLEANVLRSLIDEIERKDAHDPALPYLKDYFAELDSRLNGMTLLDVIEMLADWKAAGQRHADGSIRKSLTINQQRFQISSQLIHILVNTVDEMDW